MALSCNRLAASLALVLLALGGAAHGHISLTDPLANMERPSQQCLRTEGFYTCRDHSHCLQLSHVCDGIKDCTDNSDEDGQCHVTCDKTRCLHKCYHTPAGPYCLCPQGLQLAKDNVTCSDFDECSHWPPLCDQLCHNSHGSFACSCAAGYSLADDQMHCHATQDQPGKALLVYTQGSSIMKISVGHGTTSSPSVVYHGRGPIYSIALDTIEARVFWFCSVESEIKAVGLSEDFSKNAVKRIITNGLLMVNTMAYEWIGQNLYIGDAVLHRIIVCSVNTDLCTAIFTSNILHVPRTLTVDPAKGKLYWSECGTSRKIETSSLDGTNTITLVRDKVYCPISLYIDQPVQTLYWVDPELHSVDSILANGTKRRNLVSKYVTNPVGLAIFEEDMYVTYLEHTKEKVLMAISDKFDYEGNHQQMSLQLSEIPTDMQIYHSVLQMPGENPCRATPCDDGICLLNDRASYKCACPAGKRLQVNQHSCTWNLDEPSLLVAHGNRIVRVLPDAVGAASHQVLEVPRERNITALAYEAATQTIFFAQTVTTSRALYMAISSFRLSESSEVKILLEDVGKVTDIAVDWVSRNLYWTDSQVDCIEMSRMDGSARMILEDVRVQDPRAIAVDSMDGKLYYSDCGAAPHIGVCELDGLNCFIQPLGMATGCVSDMFVDTFGHELYWTDSTLGLISLTDLVGINAHQIRHSPQPLSLALLGGSLFWVDGHYGDILRQPKAETHHDTRIKLGMRPLTAIVALDVHSQPQGNNGCSGAHYGGCSHLCIAKTRLHSSCLCPLPLVIGSDMKTCITRKDHHTGVPHSRPAAVHLPIEEFNPPHHQVTFRKPPRPTVSPTPMPYKCPKGQCLNDAKCKYDVGKFICICQNGWSGQHCEVQPQSLPTAAALEEQGSHAWIAALVVCLALVALLAVGLVLLFRSQNRLRPGEVFRFVRLKSSFLVRKEKDPKLEKLINPSCPDMIDNIYTDVNDINENHHAKSRGTAMVHSQSLDSVQSVCTADLKSNHNLF